MGQDELSSLEKEILEIAVKIGGEKRPIKLEPLYKAAISQLNYPENIIVKAIHKLFREKYIIEGYELTKINLLDNKKRKMIFDYIEQNPGAHIREIQKVFNLGTYDTLRNLNYLEVFGFVRSKRFMNKVAHFLVGTDETRDEKILILKNARTKQIFDHINSLEKARLSELGKALNLSHGQIQPHLKKLSEYNLINSVIENNIVYYLPIISEPIKKVTVKREFDYFGGSIRFKVAIQNNTNMSISNISVTLTPSEQFFWDEAVRKVSVLRPHNSIGVDFTLIPNTCGKSTVFGVVSYQDAFGNIHNEMIAPKEIPIKCPLVVPQTMSKFEIDEWIKTLKKSTTKIDYGNLSQIQAYDIAMSHVGALDLFKIKINSQEYSALYTGKVKVTGKQIIFKLRIDPPHIIIDVWAEDLTQTTGLLAYIRNLITISLEQSLKTLEKSEDLIRKITKVFNLNNELKDCFDVCCNCEEIRKITKYLIKIKNNLESIYQDFKVLDSINGWILRFQGMYEEENCIDNELALELEYDIIDWIKQSQELVSYDIKLYKDTYDYDKFSEDFKIGIECFNKNLELIRRTYELSILSYLIVIYKQNGLALYQERLGSVDLDADLISGFITAIQSFGTEVSKKETSVKGLKYENYNIEIATGDYIRAVILLNGRATIELNRSLLNFVNEFESHFEKELISFIGNISSFRSTKNIFHRVFELP
ncbi:MAG: hypothetical protein ACFFDN_26210 [Candidatus Hodarchaeota archaeon]